jgi:hypothetical protein
MMVGGDMMTERELHVSMFFPKSRHNWLLLMSILTIRVWVLRIRTSVILRLLMAIHFLGLSRYNPSAICFQDFAILKKHKHTCHGYEPEGVGSRQ